MKYLVLMILTISAFASLPEFPGEAKVLTMQHALIPAELGGAIQGVQLAPVDHVGVTTVRDGVEGVSHSDGVAGSRFTPWAEFQALYVEGSLQVYTPNYTEVGRKEIAWLHLPKCIETVIAQGIGEFRKCLWMASLKNFEGRPYDFFFQPDPETVYCSELLALSWNSISHVELFPAQQASDMAGWNMVIDEFGTTFGMIFMGIGVMPTTMVYAPAYVTWYPEMFTLTP